jgi:hypothetical protein
MNDDDNMDDPLDEIRKYVLGAGAGEELSDGISYLFTRTVFQEERMRIESEINHLRCDLVRARIKAAVGMNVEEEHNEIVKQMLRLSVESLYNDFNPDDLISEVMRQAQEEGLLEESQ